MTKSNTMKIVRSIPALENMVGAEATLEKHVATVREDMRRTLTPEEHREYRGITHTGEPWLVFDQLYNVHTTEDLIKAEEFGVYHAPIDRPNESFLFACNVGLVASVHPERAARLRAVSEGGDGHGKTLQELHQEYKDTQLGQKDWEDILNHVAIDYVKWACAQN